MTALRARSAVAWAENEMAATGKLVPVHFSRGLHTGLPVVE
jgi:hypothetical protein